MLTCFQKDSNVSFYISLLSILDFPRNYCNLFRNCAYIVQVSYKYERKYTFYVQVHRLKIFSSQDLVTGTCDHRVKPPIVIASVCVFKVCLLCEHIIRICAQGFVNLRQSLFSPANSTNNHDSDE